MADLEFRVNSGPVALAAATPTTVLQLHAPTHQRVAVNKIYVSFDGATSGAIPARVQVYRQTTAGTMTASPPAPVPTDGGITETIQTAVTWVATVEPTYGDLLLDQLAPVYNGSFREVHHYSKEVKIAGGGRVGVVVTAPAMVNVAVSLVCEE